MSFYSNTAVTASNFVEWRDYRSPYVNNYINNGNDSRNKDNIMHKRYLRSICFICIAIIALTILYTYLYICIYLHIHDYS